jgi:hypothetical protein
MSETMRNNWSVQVAGMVLIAIVGTVHFGRRRSNVLEVMSGTGDERVRTLSMLARRI